MRFKKKIFLGFMIFLTSVLVISGCMCYFTVRSILGKNFAENQMQTTQKIQEQLDSLFGELNRITITINSSEFIKEELEKIELNYQDNYFEQNPIIAGRVKNILYNAIAQTPFKVRIRLVSPYLDYIGLATQYDKKIDKTYLEKNTPFKQIMESNSYKVFYPDHEDIWVKYNTQVFSIIRPLRDNYGVYGGVHVSVSTDEIDRVLYSENRKDVFNIVLLNDKNEIIYSTYEFKSEEEIEKLKYEIDCELERGSFITTRKGNGTQFIASYSKLEKVEWTLVQFDTVAFYESELNQVLNILIFTYVVLFVFMVCVLYLFVQKLTKPIIKLTDKVMQIDVDNLSLQLDKNEHNNEIDLLARTLQNLLDTIQVANQKLIVARENEMRAHLLALQAQLNPHFLYNTLAVIGAFGHNKGNLEVSQMCADLSHMLRYTIEGNEQYTKIGNEIEHVRSYLKLMNRRYMGALNYTINVDETLLQIPIPRLILQPIVENAFTHGFLQKEYPWEINVEGSREENKWVIKIVDNGIGFANKDKERIENQIANSCMEREEYGGIGLANTLMRIKYFYKGEEHISIYNAEGGGAIIEIGGAINDEA